MSDWDMESQDDFADDSRFDDFGLNRDYSDDSVWDMPRLSPRDEYWHERFDTYRAFGHDHGFASEQASTDTMNQFGESPAERNAHLRSRNL